MGPYQVGEMTSTIEALEEMKMIAEEEEELYKDNEKMLRTEIDK